MSIEDRKMLKAIEEEKKRKIKSFQVFDNKLKNSDSDYSLKQNSISLDMPSMTLNKFNIQKYKI